MNTREQALERTKNWWYCDNIITHPGQVGLLHMGFPRVFILMRDYDVAYWASYEKWKEDLIEVNFFDSADRQNTSNGDLEILLIDAWNFLCLEEQEEERKAQEYEDYIDF